LVFFNDIKPWVKYPGVNSINILRAAFTRSEPESVRTQSSHQYDFTLLGSAHIKAAQKCSWNWHQMLPAEEIPNQIYVIINFETKEQHLLKFKNTSITISSKYFIWWKKIKSGNICFILVGTFSLLFNYHNVQDWGKIEVKKFSLFAELVIKVNTLYIWSAVAFLYSFIVKTLINIEATVVD
jgi:hypothetical protein